MTLCDHSWRVRSQCWYLYLWNRFVVSNLNFQTNLRNLIPWRRISVRSPTLLLCVCTNEPLNRMTNNDTHDLPTSPLTTTHTTHNHQRQTHSKKTTDPYKILKHAAYTIPVAPDEWLRQRLQFQFHICRGNDKNKIFINSLWIKSLQTLTYIILLSIYHYSVHRHINLLV